MGELELSQLVSHDTVFGANWSPDGKLVSFGCTDNTLRAIDATTGRQVLFQRAHEDWVLDSVFSVDGSHLISAGRDMTLKLTEVAVERFVDNITSITPGALKGGIHAVARHPHRDEVVIGGADGAAKIYRVHRLTKRVIGDDANLIRRLPSVPGRIYSIDISGDGLRIVAGSSLDGVGHIAIFGYEMDTNMPDDIRAIVSKVVTSRSAAENERLEHYVTSDIQTIATRHVPESSIYATAFSPDGQRIAAAGSRGWLYMIDATSGELRDKFPLIAELATTDGSRALGRYHHTSVDSLAGAGVPDRVPMEPPAELVVYPRQIEMKRPIDYVQLVVRAVFSDGTAEDVTHHVHWEYDTSVVDVRQGLVQPHASGQTTLVGRFNEREVSVPVQIALPDSWAPDFVQDVNPVLSKVGCNQGTCHGSASGRNGFKLSLRGYDPLMDIRSLTDDLCARRVNLASPDESLMLRKPAAEVPHEGGLVMPMNERYYSIVREWIASGATLDTTVPRVASLRIEPAGAVLPDKGAKQQLRIVACFQDGREQDVTRESFIDSGNTEVAGIVGAGIVEAIRRGEAPITARYEGAYAATSITVMGAREGFVWQPPPAFNAIDDFIIHKWERMKIAPAPLCGDEEFLRRVYLDLTGLPPSAAEVIAFLADETPTQAKRAAVVERLIGSEPFIEHWTNKWADLLQVNRKYLGPEGAAALRQWIRDQVATNRPYDSLAREIVSATGSNREFPAASYFKIHRTPEDVMENTTHLFLGIRFNCNKCHDHPFERWTQDQYYETAAFFAQVHLQRDPASGDRTIGGTDVESPKPLFESIVEHGLAELRHDRTGQMVPPKFPFNCDYEVSENATPRETFAAWLTSPDNPYFATAMVNRLWGYLLGTGLIEPLDDIRAGNPPSNPELLEYLRSEFVASGFDMRHIMRLICQSRTYQLSIATNPWNVDDQSNFSHAKPRRLPAETLYDAIHFATGSSSQFPGLPPGTRAAAIPDAGVKLPSGLLATLGKPARESVCECERSNDLQLGAVLALLNGPDVAAALRSDESELNRLAASDIDDSELIRQIYMRILNRWPSDDEVSSIVGAWNGLVADHEELVAQREARAASVAASRPQLEAQRDAAIAAATEDVARWIADIDPQLPDRERTRAEEAALARAEVERLTADQPGRFANWRRHMMVEQAWNLAYPTAIASAKGAEFTVRADRSIRVTKPAGADVYTLEFETHQTEVSAIRIEALADAELPSKGPGIAPNGNFVLHELVVEVASAAEPGQWKPVAIARATADFEQAGFPAAKIFDGTTSGGVETGWAIAPATGVTHWVTVEFVTPVGYQGGTQFRLALHQNWDEKHQLGAFRVAFGSFASAPGLSLSEEWLAVLATPDQKRTAEQSQALAQYFEKQDPVLNAARQRLAELEQPLPIDARIVEARKRLDRARQPLPDDALLTRLNQDVEYSRKQLETRRLTQAQDLAWALINSPAFLFNR